MNKGMKKNSKWKIKRMMDSSKKQMNWEINRPMMGNRTLDYMDNKLMKKSFNHMRIKGILNKINNFKSNKSL